MFLNLQVRLYCAVLFDEVKGREEIYVRVRTWLHRGQRRPTIVRGELLILEISLEDRVAKK